MTVPWHKKNPETVDNIRRDLRNKHSNLHLHIDQQDNATVHGTLVVPSPTGIVLDRYQISIEIPADFPASLPIVRETGGRIPWDPDFHVETNGIACVMLPDERWRIFPESAPFTDFIDGPVQNFFLGQSLVELGEDWPFDEWEHGERGILEYYKQLFESEDPATVLRYLRMLSKRTLKKHWKCPCGSGKKVRKCCEPKIKDLRRKVPPAVIRNACVRMGIK